MKVLEDRLKRLILYIIGVLGKEKGVVWGRVVSK